MDGTDKQIKWARNVRAKAWRKVETEAEAAVFGAKTDASWWISADKAGEAIDFVRKIAAGEAVEFESAQPGKIFFTCKKCGKSVEIKGIPGFSEAEKWEYIMRDPSRQRALESFVCGDCDAESPEAINAAKKADEKRAEEKKEREVIEAKRAIEYAADGLICDGNYQVEIKFGGPNLDYVVSKVTEARELITRTLGADAVPEILR